MSTERNDFGTSFIIFAGSTKTFTLTIKDPDTGLVFNLSNTTDFDTGEVKIIKPDGTIIIPKACAANECRTGAWRKIRK